MAIDTRLKRQSAHMLFVPHIGSVHPFGAIGKTQRAASVWGYGGIEADEPEEEGSGSRISNIFAGGVVQ